MAFCPNCGKELASEARFCPSCGATQNQAAASMGPTPVMNTAPTQTGLQPNVAGLLCYLFGWISGLIFYFIEKDRFIRFHAVQSIIVSGALTIVQLVLTNLLWMIRLWALSSLFSTLCWIAQFGLAVFLMIKAYNNEKYKLPMVGDLAEKFSA